MRKIWSIVAIFIGIVTILYFTIAPITFLFQPNPAQTIVSTPGLTIPLSETPSASPSSNFKGPTSSPGFGVKGPTSSPPTR